MKKKWEERTTLSKACFVCEAIIAVEMIIVLFLQICDVLENAHTIQNISLSLFVFLQAVENWKENRNIAIISIVAGIILLITTFIR